jgi:hypothetical protein
MVPRSCGNRASIPSRIARTVTTPSTAIDTSRLGTRASVCRCCGRTTLISAMALNPYGSVWTSTESTGGRSRTIAVHESPPSGDA